MTDLTILGGKIVTMNSGWEIIEDGGIAIERDKIVAIDSKEAISSNFPGNQKIDANGRLILPGFINGHTHAAMSLFRGCGNDYPLKKWLENLIFPLEREYVSKSFVKTGTNLAMLEMIQGGTTTFVDMYYFEDSVAEVVSSAGMRAILGAVVHDCTPPDSRDIDDGLIQAEAFISTWKSDPLITPAIAPHAVYTCSSETLQRCCSLARKHDIPILTHLSETQQEVTETQKQHGCSPVSYLNHLDFLGSDVIAAHCTWVDDSDIKLLAEKNVGCINCPSSNTMLGSGIAPIVSMQKAGCFIGVGTDGPASSGGNIDILDEITLSARLQKVVHLNPAVIKAKQLVEMLTIGGAKAIHLDDEIGSLEVGKKADIIILNLETPHSIPHYDIYTHIAYALKSSDIETVIIDGQIVMKHNIFQTLNQAEITESAKKIHSDINRTVSDNLQL